MIYFNKKHLIYWWAIFLFVLSVLFSTQATAVAQSDPHPPEAPQPAAEPIPTDTNDNATTIIGVYGAAANAAGPDGVVPSGFIYGPDPHLALSENLDSENELLTPSGTGISCTGGTGTYGGCIGQYASDYIDISATGTAVALTNDGSQVVYSPFNFNYYGMNYSTFWINANGFLTFEGPESAKWAGGHTLPSTYGPENLIAAWWEDLRPDLGGTIHYQFLGEAPYRYLVVQFKDVPTTSDGIKKISFQLKMYETTNHIEITYTKVEANTSDGTKAVIGYENSTGTAGRIAFDANDDLIVPVTVIFFKPEFDAAGCYARVGGVTYGTGGSYASSAIQNAVNAAAATDTILLAGDCYSNTATGVNIDNKSLHFKGGYTTSNWSIPNHASTPTILNGFGLNRHFLVQDSSGSPASKVAFENIYLMRGNASEGGAIAIYDPAIVDLTQNVTLVHNRATYGGAVHNSGELYLKNNAQVIDNTAVEWGGGIDNDGTLNIWESNIEGNSAIYGGGVFNQWTTGITSVWGLNNSELAIVQNNTASIYAGGIYNAGTLYLREYSILQANEATYGGGIYNDPAGTLTFKDSGSDKTKIISFNTATYGGGIYSDGTINSTCNSNCYELFRNFATGSNGGGLYIAGGTATLTGMTIGRLNNPNRAANGAGIYSSGSLNLNNSTVHYNADFNIATNGGGIYHNAGSLTITGSTIDNNAAFNGGGIFTASGTLTLDNTTLTNNSADGFEDKGGAIYIENSTTNIINGTQVGVSGQPNTAWFGGGIYNNSGTLNINASTVDYNTASLNGGGIYNASGNVVTIENSSQMRNNQADKGGAIYNLGQTDLKTNANIDNNNAVASGGGVYNGGTLNGSGNAAIVNNDVSGTFAEGAGVYNNDGTVILNSTRINDNTAPVGGVGGGIWNNHILEVYNSQISDNQVDGHGGGIRNDGGNATITQSSITGNTASSGGGISNVSSTAMLNMTETTLANNLARESGGGFLNAFSAQATVTNSTFSNNGFSINGGINSGGGIWNGNVMTVVNSTLSGNGTNASPNAGGGIATQGTLYLTNSIVANSLAGGDCKRNSGEIIDNGPNLIEDGSCAITVPSALTGDPALAPLADNGGSTTPAGTTHTHALTGGSPAINNGDCNGGTLTTSQNGVARLLSYPQFCDIGAYEYEAIGTPLLDIGRDFRRIELTQNSINGSQAVNIPTLEKDKNFSDYDSGQLFDRYCVAFDQLQSDLAAGLETDCTVWNGLNGPAGNHPGEHTNLDLNGTRPVNVYNTLRNSIALQQEQAFRYALDNPPLTIQAISQTLEAIREIHYIGMIYANEFYADAVRYRLYAAPLDPSGNVINEEIATLEMAYQQYNIVANSMALLGERELPAGKTVNDYYTAEDLEMFALATTRQGDVALEIARRQQLKDPVNNSEMAATRLDTEYAIQQRNLDIFVGWLNALYPTDAQRDAAYENYRGQGIAISMEMLSRWADDIRSSNNPFGYRSEYVPRVSYDDIETDTQAILAQTLPLENAAQANAREYEATSAALTSALNQLDTTYGNQLLALCGIDVDSGGSWDDACRGGAMAKNVAEMEGAASGVDLAIQQIANYSSEILIEQDRAGAVQIELTSASGDISLELLQIAKLNAVQEIKTDFETDSENTRHGTRIENKVESKISVKGSSNPLNTEATSEVSVSSSIAGWVEKETEHSTGNTTETVKNPNLQLIGEAESRIELRTWESQATINGIESDIKIRLLLLAQSDALIALDIAYAEFNAVLAEHNLLVAQWADLKHDRDKEITNFQNYFDSPSLRLIHDQTSADYYEQFTLLQQYAFLTAKALEYDWLDDTLIPYNDLYRARRVQDVASFLNTLNNYHNGIGYAPADLMQDNKISIATHTLGLSNDYVTSLINDGFTVDPLAKGWPDLAECAGPTFTLGQVDTLRKCLFQEYLYNQVKLTDLGPGIGWRNVITIPFRTPFQQIYTGGNTWNARITKTGTVASEGFNCTVDDKCTGVSVDIITDQQNYTDGPPEVNIDYTGDGTYRTNSGEIVHYQPGPVRIVGLELPAGFPTENLVSQPINADVNGANLGSDAAGFKLLGAVSDGWFLTIDISDTVRNGALIIPEVLDFEINIQTVSHGTTRLAEVAAQITEAETRGEAVDPALRAEYEALLNESAKQTSPTAPKESNIKAILDAIRSMDSITDTTYIDPLVPHGTYQGSMLAMGFAELGVVITATDVTAVVNQPLPLEGALCVSCSILHTAAEPLTGQFVNTGTPTNTFSLASAPISVVADGEMLTKTYEFEGLVLAHGNIISGTYREVVNDSGVISTLYTGYFNMSRWSRLPGAITPTMSIAVGPTDYHPVVSWLDSDENCSYQLFHSGLPYFVTYPRQLASSTTSLSYTDNFEASPSQPIYYRLRGYSCSPNLDYLDPDARYSQDSVTMGVFSFDIVPGN